LSPIVYIPYRWSRRPLKNLSHIWYGVTRGVGNLWRWLPIIWHDKDWDWEPLAEMMEFKLRRMARVIGNGSTASGPRDAKDMLICAEILKRLRADEYHGDPPYERSRLLLEESQAADEQRLLGKIIGTKMRGWWD
jgi:hypothetical protein